MKAIERRAAEIGDRTRSRRTRELADRLRELVPDAGVEERGSTIQLTGAGLRRRWLNDPELRFVARMLS